MTDGIPDTKLMFKYVEVGRFDKTDEELTSLSDKWMYVLKNLSRLDNRPAALREKIFSKLFAAASLLQSCVNTRIASRRIATSRIRWTQQRKKDVKKEENNAILRLQRRC